MFASQLYYKYYPFYFQKLSLIFFKKKKNIGSFLFSDPLDPALI